jgi:XTP/dITP diphosphohydrolase/tetrapyrrole methylase family protein/MazG family protein/ATP diphosphatase
MTQAQAAGEALLALDRITRRLRRECPWDRAQDERSIVPHTVEEAYELADAAHAGDDAKLLDELGDVLFQVHFLALLLEERDAGDLERVARGVTEKLVRRHPHVFGGDHGALARLPTGATTPAEVRENWDAIKREEAGRDEAGGGVPESLPALLHARKLQGREGVRLQGEEALGALRARLDETAQAFDAEGAGTPAQAEASHGSERLYEHVGELLFAAVALARSLQVDPELALRQASQRFSARAGGAP